MARTTKQSKARQYIHRWDMDYIHVAVLAREKGSGNHSPEIIIFVELRL